MKKKIGNQDTFLGIRIDTDHKKKLVRRQTKERSNSMSKTARTIIYTALDTVEQKGA